MRDFFNGSINSAHIIIIDNGYKEGLDLANVSYMHLAESISTIGDFEQATARVARKCMSERLPVIRLAENLNLRFVSIFTYNSRFPTTERLLSNVEIRREENEVFVMDENDKIVQS